MECPYKIPKLHPDQSAGNLWLSYLYSTNPKDLGAIIYSVAERAADLCPDATLIFDAVNDMSVKLAEKIFPKAVKVNIYEATTYGDIPTQPELLP